MRRRAGFAWMGLLLAALCPGAAARDDEAHTPIDRWMEAQMAKDPSTAGQRRAILGAAAKWDAQMNRDYRALLDRLDPRARTALQRSQRAWLAFRDAEFAASAAIMARKQGTMWLPVGDDRRMQVVRDRAMQLAECLRILKE